MVQKSEEFVVCIAHPNKSAYSETFIRAHIEHLPAKVIDLHGVWFPLRYNQSELKQFFTGQQGRCYFSRVWSDWGCYDGYLSRSRVCH